MTKVHVLWTYWCGQNSFVQDAFQDFLWNGGGTGFVQTENRLSEVVLRLNQSGHDDQIRHERVHGEAHSALPILVREAHFL